MSSSSSSKAVVRRAEGGAVVTASASASAKKRPARTALEEDEFTDALTKIVRRDFFPDVAKLEAQLEFIEASETNDYERLRAISQRFPSIIRTPNPTTAAPEATPSTFETPLHNQTPLRTATAPGGPSSTATSGGGAEEREGDKPKPEDHTLDKFLSKYESEDDASFAEIMEKTKAQHMAKHAWLFEKEAEYARSIETPEARLAITDGRETQRCGENGSQAVVKREEPRRSGVETWTYTAKNTLMYIPDGLEQSVAEKMAEPDKKREVVHSNTRLSGAFLRKMHVAMRGGASADGEEVGQKNKDKVGVDGKILDPSSSPQVNGYSFVATPQIQPGVDASPLMTWGSIEGTPVHLETDIIPSNGPTFKMPKIPRREEVAQKLADKAAKSSRERRKAAASPALLRNRLGTPATPAERLQLLSPAARKLASRAATPGSARGVDKALRQSYTPQRVRTPSSTPSSTPRPAGSSRPTPILGSTRGGEGSATPSLTDNLLDLKSR